MLENDSTLKEQGVQVRVYGRTKELYSLWHKMETKEITDLEQIHDVVALRVVLYPNDEEGENINSRDEKRQISGVPSLNSNESNISNNKGRGVWLCYHVLGLVQHLPGFQPVPTRVCQYIEFSFQIKFETILLLERFSLLTCKFSFLFLFGFSFGSR
jgi:GTP pyrophosphokinase